MKTDCLLFMMAALMAVSCDKEQPDNRTLVGDKFDNTSVSLQYDANGGADTITHDYEIPTLYMIWKNDSIQLFAKPITAELDSIVHSKGIKTAPAEYDPLTGYTFVEWDWLSVELRGQQVLINIKPNSDGAERTAKINVPNNKVEAVQRSLEINISQTTE